ncbi:MAG: DNA-directed DNA polymerase I [Candidatus Asgardarchaeia archaeon]
MSNQSTLLPFIKKENDETLEEEAKDRITTESDVQPTKNQESMNNTHHKSSDINVTTIDKPTNTDDCILLDIDYDGTAQKAYLKLYDPKKNKIYRWYDTTGHKPYCLSKEPKQILLQNQQLVNHPGFVDIIEVEKYDLLEDRSIRMSKIIATDPLSIGGTSNSIRDIIKEAWEAHIPYRKCYLMDLQLIPGLFYKIENGQLVRVKRSPPEGVKREIEQLFKDETQEAKQLLDSFFDLLFTPVPDIKRVAMDIEVLAEAVDVIPDPKAAEHPIIAVAFASNYDINEVHILKRKDMPQGDWISEDNVEIIFYDKEEDLLRAVFKRLSEEPFIITFNGDNFDLNYLYHRALKLGFSQDEIPITIAKNAVLLKYGIHFDLYPFFHNRSINIYAFGNAYKETSLDAVANALLKKGKIKLEKEISELSLLRLGSYCYNDALITLELTTFNENLTMNLIILLMRISKLPIRDINRQNISAWIRGMFYYEHRIRGYLIPRPQDILAMKSETSTKAIIKGKKYKGAIVVNPIAGIHFNVVVLDFASLYPSVIKTHNLSYETVRCPHKECRGNIIPGTTHWVCKKRVGLTSVLVGFLRDIRVKWFKELAKSKDLSEDKRQWYRSVERALKVFINATYGVFGSESFELYCPPLAESTTALGRYAIQKTIEKSAELGVQVLYGDTDSVFLANPTQEQIEELKKWSKSFLNIDLDVDKIYRWVALSTRKKNYLGVFPDGTVDVKGLLGKKRNTPKFCQEAFSEMLNILKGVHTEKDFESAKKKIFDIIRESYRKLENKQYPLEDLAIKVQLTKPLKSYTKTTPQHVKAARLLESKGKKISVGHIIHFVKTVTPPNVKPVELASLNEIDVAKYKEHLKSTFEQVLDALGIEFKDIEGYTALSKWF